MCVSCVHTRLCLHLCVVACASMYAPFVYVALHVYCLRMKLPVKVQSQINKGGAKFVLFRIPTDFSIKEELDGVKIDLADLKISSNDSISAIPDLLTNPDRASACTLLPNDTNELLCGPAFSAYIQIVKKSNHSSRKKTQVDVPTKVTVKKEIEIKTRSSKRKNSTQ